MILTLFSFFVLQASPETPDLRKVQWKLLDEVKNIQTYESPLSGFSAPALKAETTLPYEISKIVSAIVDTTNRTKWTPNLDEARVLEQISPVEHLLYWRLSAPLVDDRDLVFNAKTSFDPKTKQVLVHFYSVDSPKAPKTSNVRARLVTGEYILWPDTTSSAAQPLTRVIYQTLFEFGGSMPEWLANSTLKSNPRKTLTALDKYLKEANLPEIKSLKVDIDGKTKTLADIVWP